MSSMSPSRPTLPPIASHSALRRSPAAASPRRRRRPRGRDADVVAARCRCLETLVSRAFNLGETDLRRASRGHAPVAFARQVAMYVAHVWFALSLSEVGRRFGRDRTTVAHACRVVEERRDDPRIDRVVAAIESAADLWTGLADSLEAVS